MWYSGHFNLRMLLNLENIFYETLKYRCWKYRPWKYSSLMHFSSAVLLPRRQMGDLCLPYMSRFVLHNSYLR